MGLDSPARDSIYQMQPAEVIYSVTLSILYKNMFQRHKIYTNYISIRLQITNYFFQGNKIQNARSSKCISKCILKSILNTIKVI